MDVAAVNRDDVVKAIASALTESGLRLEEFTWKHNLKRQTLSLGLKISGDLDEQQVLPFVIRN